MPDELIPFKLHPLHSQVICFRAFCGPNRPSDKMAVTVHNTGFRRWGADGRVIEQGDARIEFDGGRYVAHASTKYRLTDPVTGDSRVVDEVEYLLRSPLFLDRKHAPNGGINGCWIQIERGDEGPKRRFQEMRQALLRNPDAFTDEEFMAVAVAARNAERKISAMRGPQIVTGVRDSRLEEDTPDDPLVYGNPADMSQALHGDAQFIPEGASDPFRDQIRSLKDR
jgi:hypothetical protein